MPRFDLFDCNSRTIILELYFDHLRVMGLSCNFGFTLVGRKEGFGGNREVFNCGGLTCRRLLVVGVGVGGGLVSKGVLFVYCSRWVYVHLATTVAFT